MFRKSLATACMGACTLMVALLLTCWGRGRHQATCVAKLLLRDEHASIQAQYEPYQYELPPSLRGPHQEGMLTFDKGRGQRVVGFGVIGDPPRHLEWLIPWLGEHCFARVNDIHINAEDFSDADVDLLLAFPDLRAINVSGTALTDAGLTKLTAIKRLAHLDLSETKVSSDCVRRLSECRELRELDLWDTAATEDDVAYLKQTLPDCWVRQ